MAGKNENLDLAGLNDDKNNGRSGGVKKIILLVVAVLVIGGAGFGAALLFTGGDAPAETAAANKPSEAASGAAEASAEKLPEALYQPLDPPFVVNANNPGSRSVMQIRMQAMSYDQQVIDQLKKNMAQVRDAVILLLSAQDFDKLGYPEEKERLRGEIKKAIQSSVRFPKGTKLETVLFTEFIME